MCRNSIMARRYSSRRRGGYPLLRIGLAFMCVMGCKWWYIYTATPARDTSLLGAPAQEATAPGVAATARRLLHDDHAKVNYEKSEIDFADAFTWEEKQHGAIIMHFIGTLWMFCGLAIVCDEYFVSALEVICERLSLSDDVAGATFMAAGGSAPEFFTSLAGAFYESDVGFGTIVGSAVFNVLFVIGACAFCAGQELKLTAYPLFRDGLYYIFGLLVLVVFVEDQTIEWYEALILFILYCGYVLMMKFDEQLRSFFSRKNVRVDPNGDDTTATEGVPDKRLFTPSIDGGGQKATTVLPEAIRKSAHVDVDARVSRISNRDAGDKEQGSYKDPGGQHKSKLTASTHGGDEKATAAVEDEEAQEGGLPPFPKGEGCLAKLQWCVTFPLVVMLHFTIPDCRMPHLERFYMVTFSMSILWIGAFSYMMVWFAQMIGLTLGIPTVIMGVTFLAAGTSIPDALSSVIVAREGHGDMAVSSSIGSNIFDILVGLPVPWMIYIASAQKNVCILSKALMVQVATLLGMVFATVLSIHCLGWVLSKKLGYLLLFLYALFLGETILVEYGTFLDLPSRQCQKTIKT